MSFDLALAAAAFAIGIIVGLTGMGGGALMTPVLVLFFDVLPLTAVSSDARERVGVIVGLAMRRAAGRSAAASPQET